MPVNTYAEFNNYFRTLATEHVGINDFVQGLSERPLNRETSRINYPIVWLQYPDVVSIGQGENLRFKYEFDLYFLSNAPIDDWDREEENMSLLEGIAKDFLARLHYDARQREFEFNYTKPVLFAVTAWSADNLHGWRLEASIETIGEFCYDPDVWVQASN
ncbi:MAG: hypothetical protein AAFU67_00330 [Bacteroidota bacterium]